jgi:hypothetical protein
MSARPGHHAEYQRRRANEMANHRERIYAPLSGLRIDLPQIETVLSLWRSAHRLNVRSKVIRGQSRSGRGSGTTAQRPIGSYPRRGALWQLAKVPDLLLMLKGREAGKEMT